MLLWLGFSVLTAVVVVALVRPLLAERAAPLDAAAADMAVYRDQMSEIAADRERGLIGDTEAEAARAEVARRLLAREADQSRARTATGKLAEAPRARSSIPVAAAVVAALVPLGAIALYLKLGSPGLPSQPYEARLKSPSEKASLDELVVKVEKRLRDKPDDGQGWDVVAPVYMVQERHLDAANAYARAISLLGETPKRLAGLAEAHVLAANGMVNETARLAYERLRTLEPGRMEPRFWLALAKEQDGKLDAAATDYRALLAEGPSDAPWREMVEARLREVQSGRTGTPSAEAAPTAEGGGATPVPGPRAEDIEAASRMTSEQRAAMIEEMVGGLAARLKANGKDLSGWLKLVRAYAVLGRRADAVEALKSARGHLAGDTAALGELEALAKSLGLET